METNTNDMVQYSFMLVLYLATQFIPLDKQGVISFFDPEAERTIVLLVSYNKSEKKWDVKEKLKPQEVFKMVIDDKKHSIRVEGVNEEPLLITEYLALKDGQKILFKKIKKIDISTNFKNDNEEISVLMKKNELTLFQNKGFLESLKTIKITY
ncbi:MAG: hypothetical protein EAZ85_07450 [Bacteroidetes bacterium]|nr:MAG: hypothetical protein EAZ85_07450 [Bacteroidota bacterium]TAG86243.1 MAG: hypothetical protein EAZ20_13205 [Bacteroidota bacterium]